MFSEKALILKEETHKKIVSIKWLSLKSPLLSTVHDYSRNNYLLHNIASLVSVPSSILPLHYNNHAYFGLPPSLGLRAFWSLYLQHLLYLVPCWFGMEAVGLNRTQCFVLFPLKQNKYANTSQINMVGYTQTIYLPSTRVSERHPKLPISN